MIEDWLLGTYGKRFIYLSPQTTLASLHNTITNDTADYIVTYTDDPQQGRQWRSGRIANLFQWDILPDDMLTSLTLEDVPIPLADAVYFVDTDMDADTIDEKIREGNNRIYVILNKHDDTPVHAILVNTVNSSLDEKDVMFTAYHPSQIVLNVDKHVYIYVHTPDVIEDIKQDNREDQSSSLSTVLRKTSSIKVGTKITVVPEDYDEDVLDFSASALAKRFDNEWIRFDFEFRAIAIPEGKMPSVRFSIQIATIEIACLEVAFSIVSDETDISTSTQSTRNYQQIFISYSRKDTKVARNFYKAQLAAGNIVFLDVESIHAGELWLERLKVEIEKSDFLQLFWSKNSKASQYTEDEYTYCIKYKCPDWDWVNHPDELPKACAGIIRPVYWKKPLPKVPPILSPFNFKFVDLDT